MNEAESAGSLTRGRLPQEEKKGKKYETWGRLNE